MSVLRWRTISIGSASARRTRSRGSPSWFVTHLWAANDEEWRSREDSTGQPICSGAESFLAGTASCRIEVADVDALFAELKPRGVLHDVSRDEVGTTDFGTREFATADRDGNLLTFFRWERG
jgi:hypothetical protein